MERLDLDIAEALAERWEGLPHRLGLSPHRDAQWSDFVQLPPNRDLPGWVDDAPTGSILPRDRVAAFEQAHHLAAAWGIVADRMDDGQLAESAPFEAPRGALLAAWEVALHRACGDLALARATVGDSLQAWERGTALERSLFQKPIGPSGAALYARSVGLRLTWVHATSTAMLKTAGQPERVEGLRASHAAFMCGLQCRDDAFDADDDRRVRGAAVHEVLGVPRGALVRAAPASLRRASTLAHAHGFHRLGAWIAGFVEQVDVHLDEGDHFQCELAGLVLSAAIAEVA